MSQEIAGQNEERYRHDLELFDAGKQLERNRVDRHFGHREQEGQDCQAKRDGNRHAGQHQGDEQPKMMRAVISFVLSGFAEVTWRQRALDDRIPDFLHAFFQPVDMAMVHGVAIHQSGKMTMPPAGSGNTSGSIQTGWPDRPAT